MKPAFSHYYFPRCIFWSRWGWTGHWGAVRGPPGGSECHADPQRTAVHVLRRSHCQSLWPGGRCRWSLSPVSGCKDESVDVVNSVFYLLQSHECVAVFEGHSSKVSCLLVSTAPSLHHRLYTGSSDQTVRCYSLKVRTLFFLFFCGKLNILWIEIFVNCCFISFTDSGVWASVFSLRQSSLPPQSVENFVRRPC